MKTAFALFGVISLIVDLGLVFMLAWWARECRIDREKANAIENMKIAASRRYL
jgi:hypothetical protein